MTRHDHGLASNRENPSGPDGPATRAGLVDPAAQGPRAPLRQAILIDRACARFEDAWRQGQVLRIEPILASSASPAETGPCCLRSCSPWSWSCAGVRGSARRSAVTMSGFRITAILWRELSEMSPGPRQDGPHRSANHRSSRGGWNRRAGSAITSCWESWLAAAWGWSTGPGRSASIAWSR